MEKAKRQVAHIVKIKDILSGKYTKEYGEWAPNYVLVEGNQVSRVNMMGAVIAADQETKILVINDGSGSIAVRSFEDWGYKADVGDIVVVIGRPREFNDERYIVPEIIKKIDDNRWVELRKAELMLRGLSSGPKNEDPIESETAVADIDDDYSKVFKTIREADNGDGADTQEVISKSGGSEAMIRNLLKEGEIFEIRPGRLKILE